jgi:2-hydroxychromene-2-carboxylate isomerase
VRWRHDHGADDSVKPPFDFYFDFSSPYGYIASEKIEALAAKRERGVDWHPILLGVVFKHTGGGPVTELPDASDAEQAVATGVFGSPFIVVGGEPFWGVDQLDQGERRLSTGGW